MIQSHSFVFDERANETLVALEEFDVGPASVALFGEERNRSERQTGDGDRFVVRTDGSVDSDQAGVVAEIAHLRRVHARRTPFDGEHLQALVDRAEELGVEEEGDGDDGRRRSAVHTVQQHHVLWVAIEVVVNTFTQGVSGGITFFFLDWI